MEERGNGLDHMSIGMAAGHGLAEAAEAHGTYVFECYASEDSRLRGDAPMWSETIDNVVCTIGKNVMLNAALAGSGYTTTGPYLGLISSTSFSAVAAADTMASHAGWLEAGGANAPTYSGTRVTATMAAASAGAIATAANATYNITGSGTIQGAFLCFGTGAVNTIGSTAGTLYSAGTFGTPQPVVNGNVVTVSYSTSL